MDAQVRFDAAFDGANGVPLETLAQDGAWEVHFLPAPHGGTEVLWFRFRLHATSPTKVRLCLRCADNLLGHGRADTFWPVIHQGDTWTRLAQPLVRFARDGQPTLCWDLALETTAEIAFCFPYDPADLAATLSALPGAWHEDVIGLTQAGHPLTRLSNRPGDPAQPQPGLYLTARQHSGETPGSWVLDGLLRAFADAPAAAPLTWVVPFAHLDGVLDGDYGKDPFPRDVNRSWGIPPQRHENHIFQHDLRRWKQRTGPRLFLDLHAPGGHETAGVFCFLTKLQHRFDLLPEITAWMQAFRDALGDFAAPDFIRAANYPSRFLDGRSASSVLPDREGVPAVTLEFPYGAVGGRVLSIDDYREIGRRLATVLTARLV